MNDAESGAGMAIREATASLKRSDTARAETLLSNLFESFPENAEGLYLMGVVRAMQGRAAEAENCYRRALMRDPELAPAHHNLGNLLRVQRRFHESAAAQDAAIRLKANYAEAHLGRALALSALGNHEAAEQSCREALRIQPNYQLAMQALAIELIELNRSTQAEQLLRRMLSLGVRETQLTAMLEHNLAIALRQQERFHEALALFDAARARQPGLPALDYNRANTLLQLGLFDEAKESYTRAHARDPHHVETLALLALTSALTSDWAGARDFGERATALAPRHAIALVALAIADIEEGAFSAANEKLRGVLDDPELKGDKQTGIALGYAAEAFDRQGQVPQAFALHRASNEWLREIYSEQLGTRRITDDIRHLIAHFQTCDAWLPGSAASPGPDEAASHVFVLGFMRSGTTLLETVLASNPAVIGSDETEFLTEPTREFLLSEAGLMQLAGLGDSEAASWRDRYWKSVRQTGAAVAGRVFVDKMPFNSLRLPLIARLFPDAKVLLAVRDPRDVVISCYRRRFNATPFSYEFLRLDDCARFYASTMGLVELYREKLPLKLKQHRYEDMISDFDSSVREVCDFIGIAWSESMRDFRSAAAAIDSRSASATQVRQGLYDGATGQWRRYREHMQPVSPLLDPWVERYGYPPK